MVVAGPGSGKTTVLAARIAYLVALHGVSPTSILALTFATKAARELRERLAGVLGEAGRWVEVATFHAFGLRVVRHWAEELGFRSGPLAVPSPGEATALLREAAQVAGWDLQRISLADLAALFRRHRLGKGTGRPPRVAQRLSQTLAAYEALLRRRGAVDYPAMLSLPLALFAGRPDALRLYQDAYRHVIADEFHDVCPAQYVLLRHLAARHRNLAVVADPCQAIYGWRGADVGLLARFQVDFPEARALGLSQNFRSSGRIVALANALGAGLPYHRPLWTDNPPGGPALLHVALDAGAEAAFVAGEVARLLADGGISHPGEAAVLYRANWQAEALAVALGERHIPYRRQGTAPRAPRPRPHRTQSLEIGGEDAEQEEWPGDPGEASGLDGAAANRAVTLSTVHAAKGGEWRVVFLVGAEEGILPDARAGDDASPEGDGLEEERRVAYVAVTRPRERLYLSRCRGRRHGGSAEPRLPSRFLRGLPVEPWQHAA